MKILVAGDYQEMSRKAANIIAAQIIMKQDSVLGLATGSTPIGIYDRLIELYQQGDLDFSRVSSFNLDEYCGLSPEHEQSYRYYMNQHLFESVNIRLEETHVPSGLAEDMEKEGQKYDELIEAYGGIDLQLLGIGNTGHIGFNEPEEYFPKETRKVKLAQKTIDANARFFNSADDVPKYAITMGMQTIMHAKKILLAANGEGKAEILYEACFGPVTPKVPASILQLHPNVIVVADKAAASVILKKEPEAVG